MARPLRKVSTTNVVPVPAAAAFRDALDRCWWSSPVALAVGAAVAGAQVAGAGRNGDEDRAAGPVAVAPGRVALNAFPWGEVTSIRNVANGATIELKSPFVTPAPVDLAPGTYEITLSNPAFRSPITRKVDVKAGQEQLVNVALRRSGHGHAAAIRGGTP